ncbi:hypothetical protein SDC9_180495 [bioreactor metagenome]|uniref:Uncharacterized protein n=1 Tax=bioreactor metagenome TaxID=1076179 RepID=A0A645H3W0_9ZZZZ
MNVSGANTSGGSASASIDLMYHYGYNFENMKNIRSFNISGNQLQGMSIQIVSWLQKK